MYNWEREERTEDQPRLIKGNRQKTDRSLTIGKRNDKESGKRENPGRKQNRRKHNDLVLKRKRESKFIQMLSSVSVSLLPLHFFIHQYVFL